MKILFLNLLVQIIKLNQFSRNAEWEVAEVFQQLNKVPSRLIIDLRDNKGGDLGKMTRVAALFIGSFENALYLQRILDDGYHQRSVLNLSNLVSSVKK